MKKNTIICLAFIAAGGVISASAQASCGYGPGMSTGNNLSVSLGNVIVQRDTPVGTVLVKQTVNRQGCGAGTGCQWFVCDTPWTLKENIGQFTQLSEITGVYRTNLNGIGIRMYNDNTTGNVASWYYPVTWDMGANQWRSLGTTVELVRINAAQGQSGAVTSGLISTYTMNGTQVATINLNNTNVTFVACTVTTNNVSVDLQPVQADAFTAPGVTRGDQTFTIGLQCDAGARINASLSGTRNPDTTNASVLALTNAGASGVATGVGIQLLYGNSPLKLGENIVLKTSTGGQEFPPGAFSARYFQTKTQVLPGDANATAVLNLTYQ